MIRLLNQVVCICAWLTNFQPVLVPPPMEASDEEISEYFQKLEDSDITDQESDDECEHLCYCKLLLLTHITYWQT